MILIENIKKRREWLIFVLSLLIFAVLTKTEPSSWNDSSRMATIYSLVHEHTFAIDKSPFVKTGDKYFYEEHYYSDKPPILQIYSSLFYFILYKLDITFNNNPNLVYYLITLLSIGVTSSIGLVYFFKSLKYMKVDDRSSIILTLIACTGSLVLPYSLVYNNHIVSGSLLMISFYYLLKIDQKIRYAIIAGFLMSLAGSIDITTFIFIPCAFIIFLNVKLKTKLAYILSTIPIIALYLFINLQISGSIIPPSINEGLWIFPGSAFDINNLSGRATHNSTREIIVYSFHMILGNRGLLSYTPILLFSIFSLIRISRKNSEFKKYYLYITISITAFLLFYILFSNNYSGLSFGVRWFASIMLLSLLPISEIVTDIEKSNKSRVFFILLAEVSILFSLIGTVMPYTNMNFSTNSLINSLVILILMNNPIYYFKLLIVAITVFYIFYKLLRTD